MIWHREHTIVQARALAMALLISMLGLAGDAAREDRVAIQVDQNDPDVMNLAMNGAKNVLASTIVKVGRMRLSKLWPTALKPRSVR